ncbi:hypothetical protein KY289_003046 [Solanum tuberosum]|nr:hypothetical protein KY289_003046 [Solanum tuberosum]
MAAAKSVKVNNEDYGNKKKEMRSVKWESSSPTLAEMLTIGETDLGLLGKKKEKTKTRKKKPIIPLVADLFSRKKRSSTSVDNPLFASSHLF